MRETGIARCRCSTSIIAAVPRSIAATSSGSRASSAARSGSGMTARRSASACPAATSHPDFDDTPLYDEDGDGRKDNDGRRWHSHWVVLVPDATRSDGALKVRDIADGERPKLPDTWPKVPLYLDSPGYRTTMGGHTVRVRVPLADLGFPKSFRFDGVTAALRVNADLHDPLLQHNVADDNAAPERTARALAAAGADLIALQELTPQALPVYQAVLAAGHPHRIVVGSVGLWSRYPLADGRPVGIRPKGVADTWNRGLRSTVRTPAGDVAVYVAHLPLVRIRWPDGFDTARRDESAAALGAAIAGERLAKVVLLGDLNGTAHDRGLAPLTSRLTPARGGFAFTWPAVFPLARIDHVMARGAVPVTAWTLPATGSDHLPTAARLRLR